MNNFLEVLKYHLNKYPLMQAEDIYKLAYQFYFGPAHFINDKDKALAYLFEEAKSFPAKEIEVVDLGNYSRYSLINDKEYLLSLFDAFYESAKISNQPVEGFVDLLNTCLAYFSNDQKLYQDLLALTKEMKALNYPAISHSETYRNNYYPHYRLINKKFVSLIKLKKQ